MKFNNNETLMDLHKLSGLSKLSVIWLFGIAALSSCVSTDTLDMNEIQDTDTGIVLNLYKPDGFDTRADNENYKLRYIAQIARGSSSNNIGSILSRQEIIDGETETNRVIFKVDPGYDYTIMVFADYLPAETMANSKGHYEDYFYNTTDNEKLCKIRTTPGSDEQKVSPDFFNNDNYDAFFGKHSLHKEAKEEIVNMTLKRITAQVKFNETKVTSGEGEVAINKLSYRKSFFWETGGTSLSDNPSANLGNIYLSQNSIINGNNQDLFYFYTLAGTTNSSQNVSIEFTVKREALDPKTTTVNEIPVKANYRTIVKGNFMPLSPEDPPIDEDKTGNIILNLSTDGNWEQEELSK